LIDDWMYVLDGRRYPYCIMCIAKARVNESVYLMPLIINCVTLQTDLLMFRFHFRVWCTRSQGLLMLSRMLCYLNTLIRKLIWSVQGSQQGPVIAIRPWKVRYMYMHSHESIRTAKKAFDNYV
jgi:hypothetical protein